MRHHLRSSAGALLLGAAVFTQAMPVTAEPLTCNNTDFPIVNEVIFDSLDDRAGYIAFHNQHFILEPDNGLVGIEEDLHRDVNKHMLASVLITRGIGGTALPPDQDSNGQWFLPRVLAASPFHRSADEWGLMVGGWGLHTFATVDGNGVIQPGRRFHAGHRSRKAGDPLWGDAQNRRFLDFDSLPDTALEYDCECFDKPEFTVDGSGNRVTLVRGTDAIGFARTIVHESWHTTRIGHSDSDPSGASGNECNEAQGSPPQEMNVCNAYYPQEPGSHQGELALRIPDPFPAFVAPDGPGPYQLGEEFTCDLALHAADWVPLMVSLEADFDHADLSRRDYYTNIDRFEHQGPFACDEVVHAAFRRAAGLGTCGNDRNVCRDEQDCDQSNVLQLCVPPGGSSCQACFVHADCPPNFVCQANCCARNP